jgi:hypothetical protein
LTNFRTFPGRCLYAALMTSVLWPLTCNAQIRWDFNQNGRQEGWTIPDQWRGVVMGGSLWLTLSPKETDPQEIASFRYQNFGDTWKQRIDRPDVGDLLMLSPADLNLNATDVTQVKMRVLNLSSLTDFSLAWKTKEDGWGARQESSWLIPPQSRRCTMKPDLKQWQELTCHIDRRWSGHIDQIELLSAQRWLRGDVWIDWIEIGNGPPETPVPRPDVGSPVVTPRINIPGLSQLSWADAFKVMDENLTVDVPYLGFNYPFLLPGVEARNGGWWLGDDSRHVEGLKWANERVAEDMMRGFAELQAQNPDGRIDLMGEHGIRGQVGEVSQFPFFFETAYHMLLRTSDVQLRASIYDSMQKYLEWWLSPVKRDGTTGLIAGVYEEGTDTEQLANPFSIETLSVAQVDTNVAVAVGAARTADAAAVLLKSNDERRYRAAFSSLTGAVNKYLWNEELGAYQNFDLVQHKLRSDQLASMFYPMRLAIAPASRKTRLLEHLLDPSQFSWGRYPLPIISMRDNSPRSDYKAYTDTITFVPPYVVTALLEIGEPKLAAELNWQFIKEFHGKYRESIAPSTGEPDGIHRFTNAATEQITAVIDRLFGVDCDIARKRLTIAPLIPKELYGQDLSIENVILPNNEHTRMSLHIRQTDAEHASVLVKIEGPLPQGTLRIFVPGTGKTIFRPLSRVFKGAV